MYVEMLQNRHLLKVILKSKIFITYPVDPRSVASYRRTEY